MKYDAVTFLENLFRPQTDSSPDIGVRVEDLDMDWRLEWEERAAILEHDSGHLCERAEALALTEIVNKIRRADVLSH
jgi:hypothetical protein